MSMPKRHYDLEEIRLAKTSGVEGFEYEGRAKNDILFSVSCDENDGPVLFHFSSEGGHYSVPLNFLRGVLEQAETRLLRDRKEWKSSGWNEPA